MQDDGNQSRSISIGEANKIYIQEHTFNFLPKKFGPFLDLCVSSLRRGHANLLCIVPILSDVSEETTTPST